MNKKLLTVGAVVEIGASSVTRGGCSDTISIEALIRYMG